MGENVCANCGKEKTPARAGSITSYFFQHNYCQCAHKKDLAALPDNQICLNCGKSRPENQKVGSLTGFLFKELRCQCKAPRFAQAAGKENFKRTSAAARTAQKKLLAKISKNRRDAAGVTQNENSNKNGGAPINEAVEIACGTVVGGTLKIISLIGEGGMGKVYLARHEALSREFALKILSPSLISQEQALRFQAEAKTLAALNHTNLVQVYDLGIHGSDTFYYSMDYLEGRSLEEVLASDGPLSLKETLTIYLAVLDGLTYAHRNGVIHRDIKPGNIFICDHDQPKTGAIKILDFGIAKLVNSSENQKLTAAGEVFGSPYYMSPEQCAGGEVDARSDIYSIGCSMFETLSGFVPFEAPSSLEIALMHEEEPPPSLADVQVFLPQSINLVIAKCLAKLPRDRYQSAKELAMDLERVQEGQAVSAVPPSTSGVKKPAKTELNYLAVIALVVALSLFSTLAFFAWKSLSGKRTKVATTNYPMANLQDSSLKFSSSQIDTALSPEVQYVDEYLDLPAQNFSQKVVSHGKEEKVFNFPAKFSIGTIEFKNKTEKIITKPAQGTYPVPPGSLVFFTPNEIVQDHLTLLKQFRYNDLDGFNMHFERIPVSQLMRYVHSFTALQSLDLARMYLGSKEIEQLNGLTKLTDLTVFVSQGEPGTLTRCPFLPRLESLNITGMRDLSPLLAVLRQSKKIKKLSLRDLILKNQDYVLIGSLSNLSYLYFYKVPLNDDNLKQLLKLKNLRHLIIEDCSIKRSSLPYLKQFTNLEELKLPAHLLSPFEEKELLRQLKKIKMKKQQ